MRLSFLDRTLEFDRLRRAITARDLVSAEPSSAGAHACKILIDRPYRIRTTRIGDNLEPKDTSDVVIPAGDQDAEVKIQVGPQDAVTAKE